LANGKCLLYSKIMAAGGAESAMAKATGCHSASTSAVATALATMAKPWRRQVLLSACLSVCLSTRMSQKTQVQTSRNFLYVLPVTVARPPMTTTATV